MNPLRRAQVEVQARKPIPKPMRARVLARFDGCCSYPDCTETDGLEIDHVIARALGGKHVEENMAPLCGPHHLRKTRLDVKLIAKAKRLAAREDGTRRPRKPIPSHVKPWPPAGSRGFGSSRKEKRR